MSGILWCDLGGHPFSANDPDREFFMKGSTTATGERERLDVCGVCVAKGSGNIALALTVGGSAARSTHPARSRVRDEGGNYVDAPTTERDSD